MSSTIAYLSDEWFDAAAIAVAESAELRSADHDGIAVSQVIHDGPDGDIVYHFAIANRTPSLARGAAPNEQFRFEQSWSVAVALASGTVNAQNAILHGDIAFSGDHQALIAHQGAMVALERALAPVRARTDFPVG